ncbi:cation:proton antiporter, partial [Ascoidea rubescens DSM 1968]
YLAYHEPGIVTILILSSFFILLNILNHIVDAKIFCGLVIQIIIGMIYGTPLTKWLGLSTEKIFVDLGYLGLLLMVYHGGLLTSIKLLRKYLSISLIVALTGISLPFALSFTLMAFANASPIASFSAGAALSSTSLGAVFTILDNSDLSLSKSGVILSTAAMINDSVGLIMIQIISHIGDGKFNSISVIRPVFVSLGSIIITILTCRFIKLKLAIFLNFLFNQKYYYLTVHLLLLIAMITGFSYAGTSPITAVYLCGAAISWWDNELPHHIDINSFRSRSNSNSNFSEIKRQITNQTNDEDSDDELEIDETEFSGAAIYHAYFHQALNRILKPLFFASIGFSIPLRQLFTPSLLWRGVVYFLLMTLAKLACGFWVIRRVSVIFSSKSKRHLRRNNSNLPALLVGLAMIPRGEIGFLISSLAESKGIFNSHAENNSNTGEDGSGSDLYVIVIWAVVLCTLIAPILTGLVIKQLNK